MKQKKEMAQGVRNGLSQREKHRAQFIRQVSRETSNEKPLEMSPIRKEQGTHTPASPTVSAGVWPESLETIAWQGFGGAFKVYTFSCGKC
ncbi:hypothetical protein ACVCL3_08990 [Rhodanobacter sp. UC4437_H4]